MIAKTWTERKSLIYKLSKITKKKFGFNVRNSRKQTTHFITTYHIDPLTGERFKKCMININDIQIDTLRIHKNLDIKRRGFDVTNEFDFYVQVLLHEIAHYKQHLKQKNYYIDSLRFRINHGDSKVEKIADRYSIRYYKRVINMLKKERQI